MHGKAYYGSLSKVAEDTPIICNPAEVSAHEWPTIEEVRDRMPANSDRKKELLKVLLDRLTHTEL